MPGGEASLPPCSALPVCRSSLSQPAEPICNPSAAYHHTQPPRLTLPRIPQSPGICPGTADLL